MDFVRQHTRPAPVPLVPEIVLRQATDPYLVWESYRAERGDEAAPMPFWAFAWAGGQALARHLLDDPAVVAGKRVLDVGSGSGLVAVAAKLAGAAEVVANEIDPTALLAIGLNAAANGVRISLLDKDILDGDGAGADVVLIGDLCYEEPVASRIKSFVDRVADRVLIGDPGRSYLPFGQWRRVARYQVPASATLEGAETVTSSVWRPS
jgi:predicted nicotinamide N-methyase